MPIIAGYTDGSINPIRRNSYLDVNNAQHEAFALLKADGVRDIYLMTREEINLSIDAMVDGTHPSDLGMQQYASAYEAVIRRILKQPVGNISTTMPLHPVPGTGYL